MHPTHPYLAAKLAAAREDQWRRAAAEDQALAATRRPEGRHRRPWSNWQIQSPIIRRPCPTPPALLR